MGNIQHYVSAKPSPGNIRPGDIFVENEGDPKSRQRFEGTDEEYVIRYAEKTLKHPLPHISGARRKVPPAIASLYAGNDKLQQLVLSVNEKEIEKVEQSRAPAPEVVDPNAPQTTQQPAETNNVESSQEPSIPVNTVEIPEIPSEVNPTPCKAELLRLFENQIPYYILPRTNAIDVCLIENYCIDPYNKLVECIRANKEDYVVAKQECSEVLTEFGNCLQSRPEFIIAHRYAEQYSRSANKD